MTTASDNSICSDMGVCDGDVPGRISLYSARSLHQCPRNCWPSPPCTPSAPPPVLLLAGQVPSLHERAHRMRQPDVFVTSYGATKTPLLHRHHRCGAPQRIRTAGPPALAAVLRALCLLVPSYVTLAQIKEACNYMVRRYISEAVILTSGLDG